VVREIRKTDTKVNSIAQTVYALNVEEKLAMEAGCNDFITKPVNTALLIKKLSSFNKRKGKPSFYLTLISLNHIFF
jgi:CheY-like chemotaxis protein